LKKLDVDGRIILKWISRECDVRVWTDFILLTIHPTVGLFNSVYGPGNMTEVWRACG
jgi:hypothetical protein